MANNWWPGEGKEMPAGLVECLQGDYDSDEAETDLEDEGALMVNYEKPSDREMTDRDTPPLYNCTFPGTETYSRGHDSPVSQPKSPSLQPALTITGGSPQIGKFRMTTSPFSPRTSRDSYHGAALEDQGTLRSRSRSPLPGTSRDSLPWEPRENEDVVYVEEWLDVELLEADERWEEQGGLLEVPSMTVEVNVDATPLNESVAPRRSSQRGMRSRGVRSRGVRSRGVRSRGVRSRGARSRGASSQRGRRAATYAVSSEIGWCRGEQLIEVCVNESDVPPRLREMIDVLHDRNVRRDQQKRRSVLIDDDHSNSDCDPDSELGLFGGDRAALNFDWSPMGTFQGSPERFLPEVTGPIRNFLNPYDAFRAFWDDTFLQHLVVETNRYAAEIALRSEPFARDWTDTNVDEIMILFAFWMILAIHKMPTLKTCFAQRKILKTDIFTDLFTKRRYELLNRAIHFVDNSTRTPQSSRLFGIEPVLKHLKAAFRNAYTPSQHISIDESLTLWRGPLVFKQYISTKAAKFGIKTFELCDAATGYLWDFNVYTGKDTSVASSSSLPKSTTAVLDLVTPLLNKGHRLFMDNWFNSPILARYLKRNRTDCVGTIRRNRRNVPPLIQCATFPRGHFVARDAGDVMVMAYQDTKTIYTISTLHSVDIVQTGALPGRPSHYKPTLIDDYNHGMGGVDRKDQMLEPYLIERKRCAKWTRKLFKRLLNDSVLNSFILMRSAGTQLLHLAFRLDLAEQIIKMHIEQVPKPRQRRVSNKNPFLSAGRLINVGNHFVVRASDVNEPPTSGNRISKNRSHCDWCRVKEKRYSKTVYMCEACDVYLCLKDCFKKYHTYEE